MKALTKVLVLGGTAAAIAAGIVAYRRKARAGAQVEHAPPAGTMSVGVLDEVELAGGLARPMRANVDPESFDPEEVPSEHSEINELRNKMPFG